MSRASEKVAVSLDRDLFQRAERLRRASGESRSALVGRALRQLLKEESLARDIEQYVHAYERTPETTQDERHARALARHSLSALRWDDK